MGLVPTAVSLVGCYEALSGMWAADDHRRIVEAAVVLLFLAGVGLLYIATLRLDIPLHARILFPAVMGALIGFARGVDLVERRSRVAARAIAGSYYALIGLFVAYYAANGAAAVIVAIAGNSPLEKF